MVGDQQRFIPMNLPRSCCESAENTWHSRPCTVNGPQGLGTELAPKDDTYYIPVEPNTTYEINERGELRALANSIHEDAQAVIGCAMEDYFAEGQTVIQPSSYGLAFPWERGLLYLRPNQHAEDRTFENETRLH